MAYGVGWLNQVQIKLIFSLLILILAIVLWSNWELLWSNWELLFYEFNVGIGWIFSAAVCGVTGFFKNRLSEGLMWGLLAPIVGIIIILSKPKRNIN